MDQTGPEDYKSSQVVGGGGIYGRPRLLVTCLEDAKFYQDVAIELQTAYDTLQNRFSQQAHLMKEASGVLHAAESQASERQRELLNVQKDHKANVQLAVGKVVFEYREQLAMAK